MTRRFLAHFYDLIILTLITVPVYIELDSIIFNHNLSKAYYILVVLILLVLFFIFFGLIPKKLEGNIGAIMEKLRVTSTKGHLTSMRFFLKNLCSFIMYVPLFIFVTETFVKYYEITEAYQNAGFKGILGTINLTLLIIAIICLLLKLGVNIYLGHKFKQSFTDRMFDMKTVYKMHKVITINDLKGAKELTK